MSAPIQANHPPLNGVSLRGESTRRGVGKLERARRRTDVRVLDVFGNAAMVKIDATDRVDYLQEIKWNGRWVIITVVWEDRPRSSRDSKRHPCRCVPVPPST